MIYAFTSIFYLIWFLYLFLFLFTTYLSTKIITQIKKIFNIICYRFMHIIFTYLTIHLNVNILQYILIITSLFNILNYIVYPKWTQIEYIISTPSKSVPLIVLKKLQSLFYSICEFFLNSILSFSWCVFIFISIHIIHNI